MTGNEVAAEPDRPLEDLLMITSRELAWVRPAPGRSLTYRWVASRRPAQHRRHEVPYYIHKTPASLRDDEERWERITKPPLDKRTKTHRWTNTAAKQAVDQKFANTTSVQQKVERIHDLARDEQVAAVVATDLLRRPEDAFKAMTDTTARHLVNRAQVDQARGSAPRRCPRRGRRHGPDGQRLFRRRPEEGRQLRKPPPRGPAREQRPLAWPTASRAGAVQDLLAGDRERPVRTPGPVAGIAASAETAFS
ncbi:DUF6192 family protein [Nonomuraea sp. NPDC050451]|uniref:DUF6192 family protein n=1 Tax=Nonomuraea sp. NPDC050451 TaxID=3364364 RepID=UPI00378EF1C1